MFKIIGLFLFSFNLLAGDPPSNGSLEALRCPVPSVEITQYANSLRQVKDELGGAEECQKLALDIEKLATKVNSKDSRDLQALLGQLTDGEKIQVSTDQIDQIKNYSDDVSQVILSIVNKLNNDEKSACVDKKKKGEILNSVLTTTQQITGVLGGITGPYGVAINLGVATLSGIISGVNKFIENRKKRNFNFKEDTNRELFTKNFCAYNHLRLQWDFFMKPMAREKQLYELDKYLDKKLERMIEGKVINGELQKCEGCKEYLDLYELHGKLLKKAEMVYNDLSLFAPSNNQDASIDRCFELRDAIRDETSSFLKLKKMLFEEYDNYVLNRELYELIKEDFVDLKGYGKELDCFDFSSSKVRGMSAGIQNQLIRLVHGKDSVLRRFFVTEMEEMQEQLNRRYSQPLGDYTYKTMVRISWAKDEIRMNKRMLAPGNELVRMSIYDMTKQINHKIYRELVPKLLQYNQKILDKSLAGLDKALRGNAHVAELQTVNAEDLGKSIDRSKASNLIFEVTEVLNNTYGMVIASDTTILDFCMFTTNAGTLSDQIYKFCSSEKRMEMRKRVDAHRKEGSKVNNLISLINKMRQHFQINVDPIRDLSVAIRNWNARDDLFVPRS